MSVIRLTQVQLGAIFAASFALALLPRAGYGYTADQQQACMGDAFRLCSSEIPDIDRVKACMIRNRSQLSPACQAFVRPGPEAEAAPNEIRRTALRRSHVKPHRIRKVSAD
jgi:hypothetical protein